MSRFIPSGSVKVPELEFEEEVKLKSSETALIVVDMQNDFVKEDGNLFVPDAEETVPNINHLIEAARKANVKIAYTQDTQFEGDPEWEIWPKHAEKDSWGWQIIDELKPGGKDLVCLKNRYDGFYETWLDHFLSRLWKVKNVVIVGTVANICVLHTAASAGLRWFNIIVPADGISALTEFDQAMTLRQVSTLYAGKIVKSTEDIKFVQS